MVSPTEIIHLIGASIGVAVGYALFVFGMAAFFLVVFILFTLTLLSTPEGERHKLRELWAGLGGENGEEKRYGGNDEKV